MPRHDCLSTHSDVLTGFTSCGDVQTVSRCLSSLSTFGKLDLHDCFIQAGCSPSQAHQHTDHLLSRCNDISPQAQELKKRQSEDDEPSAPASTSPDVSQSMPQSTGTPSPSPSAPPSASPLPSASASPTPSPTPSPSSSVPASSSSTTTPTTTPAPTPFNNNKFGHDCFRFGITSTMSCQMETVSDKVKTVNCKRVPVTTSDCLRGYICTVDRNHQDVCMEAHNGLDTSGIIIAIVFASSILLGLGYLTFACFQERKLQKRTFAKAKAVALARAATMKQMKQHAQNAQSNDVRAPLIQHTHDNAADPFKDHA
ncbi:hypothetical protein E4U54_008375 [Claviceps lovelessii]|nr:hypothetical protein E4U54_008375 [Claviceps lovelessii]